MKKAISRTTKKSAEEMPGFDYTPFPSLTAPETPRPKNDLTIDNLFSIGEDAIDELYHRARHGSDIPLDNAGHEAKWQALLRLLHLAEQATERFYVAAKENPKIAADFCKTWNMIPFMTGKHNEHVRLFESFADKIKLGASATVKVSSKKHWRYEHDTTRLALWLIDILQVNRSAMKARQRLNEDDQPTLKKQTPQWYLDCASLTEFNKSTAIKWWNIAKQALLETYPNPQDLPAFKNLKTQRGSNRDGDVTPGELRASAVQDIREAFMSLASK